MTEQQEAELTMCMRVIEVFRKYPEQVKSVPELTAQADNLKVIVSSIFEALTDEERNNVLDRYQEDLKWLEENR